MKTHLNDLLYKVAEQTLSSLAFIFSSPGKGEMSFTAESSTTMAAVFNGPFSGVLKITMENEAISTIAENMLGMDEDEVISRDQQLDAFGESLNVICGNLLPELAGKEAVFEIGPPHVTEDSAKIPMEQGQMLQAHALMELDEGNCELCLFTNTDIETNEPVE